MNKRGEINSVGVVGIILVAFVAIIIGVALFQSVSQTVGQSTSTVTFVNESVTSTNGTHVLQGQNIPSGTVVVYNSTNATGSVAAPIPIITSGNYTIGSSVENGKVSSTIIIAASGVWETAAGSWQVTYTAEPDGYLEGADASIALLIPIFAALAIAIVALVPTLRNGFLDMIK